MSEREGFELLPHTADVMLTAWAPTVEGCLAQAVRALVATFADTRSVRPQRLAAFRCDPAPDTELLVELLDEVIYLADTQDVIPVQVSVARAPEGGLVGEFGVADRDQADLIGPAPKAITRHSLKLEHGDQGWRCSVVIDV